MADGSNPSTPTTPPKLKPPLLPVPYPQNSPPADFWQRFGNALCQAGDVCRQSATTVELFRWLALIQSHLSWSDAELARRLGLSPAYFSRLKRGQRPLTQPVANIFLEFFKNSPLPIKFSGAFNESIGMTEIIWTLVQAFDNLIMAKTVAGLTETAIFFYKDNGRRIMWFFHQQGFPEDDVAQITVMHLRALLYYVKTATKRWGIGSTSSRKHASASTVDAYWRVLQAFFSFLVGEGVIRDTDNPMRRVPRPKVDHKVIKEIPPLLFQAALASFDPNTLNGLRNRAILCFFIDSGARLIEVFRLNIESLHLADGFAIVFGKGNRERQVGIGEGARAAIEAYLAVHPHPESGPLWVCQDGTRLSRSGIQGIFKHLKKLGGGVRWSAHTLRSTWAVNLIRNGADTFSLQILGGWTDIEMPKHYTRALSIDDALRVHRRASPGDRYITGK